MTKKTTEKIIIDNIKVPINHTVTDVITAAREIVRSTCISAENYQIHRQSLDARRKNNLHYVYAVSADAAGSVTADGNIRIADAEKLKNTITVPKQKLKSRPIVAGMGPCGLFAAWILTLSGNPPIIIERGEDTEARRKTIQNFWKTGKLNPQSNVQFGEGGAGAFSDGKLTTRINDPRQRFVLKTLVDFGAPDDIMYKAKPHIGTDLLCGVISAMREEMTKMGAEVRFNTCLTDIDLSSGKVTEILVNDIAVPCDNLILAIGHSSRDTYKMLINKDLSAEPKPFAMGSRIEHEQNYINTLQYGKENLNSCLTLPAADYRIVYDGSKIGLRSCYSFCMCPGGVVVNASSEENRLAVNGMSYHSRSGRNANSALVVPVRPKDFPDGVLGGMYLQQKYEELAFTVGGSCGKAPVQLADDFVKRRKSPSLGSVIPTVTSGYTLADLHQCLPEFVTETMCAGLCDFERRMPGFISDGAVLTGIESRTSAPVRLLRGESLQSLNVSGLYPSGEGAGYAGGIVSAAVDGIRSALALLENNK